MPKLIRSYDELITFNSFEDRFLYLKLDGVVSSETFGFDRYLNQKFYASPEWKKVRNRVIFRDCGCDLGILDRVLGKRVIVHHLNPISPAQLARFDSALFDENNLITCGFDTHNAIHYGDYQLVRKEPVVRRPNDTCPWR